MMISDRFESLSQAFRVFAEQSLRFRALFLIDAPEAVGNLDHAIDGILNAFHGFYDAVKIEAIDAFNFYEDPVCAFVLRLRNARHHNQANGVRSIYRRARTEEPLIDYLLVNFAAGAGEEGGSFGEYYIAWADVMAVMQLEPQRFADSVAAGRQAIRAEQFEGWCAEHGYSERQIFVNLVPVLAAAGSACIGALAKYIRPQSVEAEAFLDIFQNVEPADFSQQEYVELTSAVFWPKR
jgi:hypothetical protein